MNLCLRYYLTSLCVLMSGLVSIDAMAAEPEARPRENSGRQLAIVIPGMAHVSPVSASPVAKASHSRTSSTRIHNLPSSTRLDGHGFKTGGLSPAQLSPEVKQAIEKGTVVANGLSKIAVRRAGDVATWVGTMWRQFNEVPVFSPSTEFSPPEPPTSSMRPLSEPVNRDRTLYYTSERRLKTVVGQ